MPSRAEREVGERSSENGRTADHVVAATGGGATSLGSAGSRHGNAHRDHSRTRRSALQAANFSSSWPAKGGLGRGGGLGPSPALARARAIASRLLARRASSRPGNAGRSSRRPRTRAGAATPTDAGLRASCCRAKHSRARARSPRRRTTSTVSVRQARARGQAQPRCGRWRGPRARRDT